MEIKYGYCEFEHEDNEKHVEKRVVTTTYTSICGECINKATKILLESND